MTAYLLELLLLAVVSVAAGEFGGWLAGDGQ